jgi:hypothetical protein
MIKQLFIPLIIILCIFFGIDYMADTLKDFIVAILPQQFQNVAPLASFLQIPIDAISNTLSSITEVVKQFSNIFISLFCYLFGDGTFQEILSAFILTISSAIAFITYIIIAVVSLVAALAIFILTLILSIASWLL